MPDYASAVEQSMDYKRYRALINKLLANDQTTGDNQSPEIVDYTRKNNAIMKRLDSGVKLQDATKKALKAVEEPLIWLVLTEGWCGDAAHSVPVIHKMAEQCEAISLKLILRDEHPKIMDAHLTNGGRSIPKLICLRATDFAVVGSWGPRPQELQTKAMAWKNDDAIDLEEWIKRVHAWYNKDGHNAIQHEFASLVTEWSQSPRTA